MNESIPPESSEDELPKEVEAALRGRNVSGIKVSESLDAVILADAEQHLRKISRPVAAKSGRSKWTWVAWSTGTLAAAALLFALMPPHQQPFESASVVVSNTPAASLEMADALAVGAPSNDIDGNGLINILDAFAMARTVEANNADGVRWDQNGDGRLNQEDVNFVALQAVML